MIHVKVRSIIADNHMIVKGLTQWDRGQTLEITGLDLPAAVEVHFEQKPDADAKTVIGTTVDDVTTAEIPDELLQCDMDILAYIYVSDQKSGETIFTIHLPIEARARPSSYITGPNPDNPFGQITDQLSEYAEKAAESAAEAERIASEVQSALDEAEGVFALKDDVGNNEDLITEDRSTIVNAINEVAATLNDMDVATKPDIDKLF